MTIGERFDDDFDAGEWQAQEHALRQERAGVPGNAGTARERGYRLLARALAEPPAETLPADFAVTMARQARTLETVEDAREQQFERWLIVAMWSVLVLAVVGVAIVYADQLVAALRAGQASSSLPPAQWLYALLGCIGASGLAQRLRPKPSRQDRTHRLDR